MEIEFQQASLFYHKEGEGKKILLFFHGFGQDHTLFLPLIRPLTTTHTCYCFDLFFHGRSTWMRGDRPIEKDEWKAMMQYFFTAEKIDQFAVIGYSLGGRAAVATLESFPKQTSALMMVAAEGVRKNFWYSWATHPVIGKPLFREMITHPNYFNRIMNRLERFSLVPRVVIEFALRQMSSREKRQRIYSSWIIFSKLYLAPRKLFTISHENRNKLVFVFGKQDPIMKESEVNRLRKILPEATIELINTSHYGLIREIPELLRKYL